MPLVDLTLPPLADPAPSRFFQRAFTTSSATRFPELWSRVEARRRLMRDELGLELPDEVLPLSGRAGCYPLRSSPLE